MQGLIGKKIGMTQIFNKDSGEVVPVTLIQTGTNVVCQVKNPEKDGYRSVQLGFQTIPDKKVIKPLLGHFKKHNAVPTRHLKEFKLDSADEQLTPGQTVGVELFENVKYVDVTGVSKGRGFAGGIKRHNFKRGRETHGCKAHRIRGSSGSNTTPGRVVPGLRMEGHYGAGQVTAKNLLLVGVDKEAGVVMIRGAVPGPNKGIVYIKKNSIKK
ncbi:MAG TPA: 50S ribosomal protein L3 [Chitinivibrionales bacterium]